MIGERERGHLELYRAPGQVAESVGAVEEGELAMGM
jgi:hypothetical protein